MKYRRQLRKGIGLAVLFSAVALVVWNMPQTPAPADRHVQDN